VIDGTSQTDDLIIAYSPAAFSAIPEAPIQFLTISGCTFLDCYDCGFEYVGFGLDSCVFTNNNFADLNQPFGGWFWYYLNGVLQGGAEPPTNCIFENNQRGSASTETWYLFDLPGTASRQGAQTDALATTMWPSNTFSNNTVMSLLPPPAPPPSPPGLTFTSP
jgi:hypothetical protein